MSTLITVLSGLLGAVVNVVSPEIRSALEGFVKELYTKAKATSNHWDDFLVELLAGVLGVTLS